MQRASTGELSRFLLPTLVYCGLSTAVISSLGVLLIPTIAEAQDVSLPAAQWILTVNLLVGSVATPVLGRLADGGHPRRVLLGTLTAVVVGSVLAATATNFGVLLAGRALQGMTYGIIPVTMTLAREHLPAPRVRHGIAALSVTAATGIGLGYPITGAIAEYLDYRVAFWLAVVIAGTALAVVPFVVPGSDVEVAQRPPFDVIGTVLFTAALGAVLLGLSEGSRWGWDSPAVLALFGGSGSAFAVWVWWELRVPAPLIRLDLLRHADVRLAQTAAFGFGMSMYAAFAAVSQLAQIPKSTGYGLGLSAFAAGLVILPLSLASQIASRLSQLLARRVGQHAILPLAALAGVVANVGLIRYHDRTWELLIAMALLGAGLGVAWAAMPTLLLGSVPAGELGSATALNHVLRSAGGAVATAALAALLAASATGGVPGDGGYQATFALSASICAVLGMWLIVRAFQVGIEPGRASPDPS